MNWYWVGLGVAAIVELAVWALFGYATGRLLRKGYNRYIRPTKEER